MFSRTPALNTWRNIWYKTCYPARVGSFNCVLAFKMETRVLSIRTWLSVIDSSHLEYQDDFEKLDFINSNEVFVSIGLHEIRSLSKRSTPAHDTECRSKTADSKQQERTRTRSGDTLTCAPETL